MLTKLTVAARQAPAQSISEELVAAIDAAIEIEHAAEDRRKRGKRSSAMFHFAHSLHGALADLGETEALEIVGRLLQMRHPTASDPWADEFPDCPADPLMAFRKNWCLIRFPKGMFECAVALANSIPLPEAQTESQGFARFKTLCRVLQERSGDRPIVLSVKRFAQALRVSETSICLYKQQAAKDGWLQQVAAAIPHSRAATFRFVKSVTTAPKVVQGFSRILTDVGTRGRGRWIESSLAMLSAFASVGARVFDVTLTDIKGGKVEGKHRKNRSMDELCRTIGRTLQEAERNRHNVIIRPRSTTAALIQLDDLDTEKAERMAPHAFLVIRTSPGNHQAWIAVRDALPDFARRLRKGARADPTASGSTRIAGSLNFKTKYAPAFPSVEITHTNSGHVVTTAELDSAGFVVAPEQSRPPRGSAGRRSRKAWPSYQRCVEGAPPTHGEDRPDISRADFTWAMTAIDWGWSIDETAKKLLQESGKARENGERYAVQTATRAAESIELRRASH
jgi:hypothetical protein